MVAIVDGAVLNPLLEQVLVVGVAASSQCDRTADEVATVGINVNGSKAVWFVELMNDL